jgi:hypothetical protein
MDSYEFFPARSSLQKSIGFGAVSVVLAWILRSRAEFSTADFALVGQATLALFVGVGVHGIARGFLGLARPMPCCTVDTAGFSVRGKRRWQWDDLVVVRLRRVWMGPIPAVTWVSLEVRKNDRGVAKRVQIPQSLPPGPANETSAGILQAAALGGWHPTDRRASRPAA